MHGATHRTASISLLLACIVLLSAPPVSSAGAFEPAEQLVTSQADLIDNEFSQSRRMMTWADADGRVWVAGVDPVTGLFVPPNGKGILVDPDGLATGDLGVVGNGPEWISTASGDQIVYTKFLRGLPRTAQNARLAMALRLGGGSWQPGFLSVESRRNAPYASHDGGDALPRISYVDPEGNHYWRNLFDPASERMVADVPSSFRSLRFTEGQRSAVFVAPVNGVSQVFLHDLGTGTSLQVTGDGGQKDLNSVPWVWRAPEYGGARVLMTIVNYTELRIYREPMRGEPAQRSWSLLLSARTPQGGIISSPEPFTHGGRSYAVLTATMPPQITPSVVFLVMLDPAHPEMRQLSPDLPLRTRRDPEVFVTEDGPWIYYNRFDAGTLFCITCNEGVFRSWTGLGPEERRDPAPQDG
jgi:hypothetical protein